MSKFSNDGTWKIVCPVCGFEKYSDQMKRRWDGVMVCEQDWEPRHPLDFFKVRPEDTSVPFSRPQPTETFEDTSSWAPTLTCVYDGCVAGRATAGCLTPQLDY